MTTTFFTPPEQIVDDQLSLSGEELAHAVRVLRHREGDVVHVVDGAGGWYAARLEFISRDEATCQILERKRDVGESSYQLTIAFSPLKSPSRLETLVEKVSELGVRRLLPIWSERTERARIRKDRLERVALAAMKQCGRSRIVEIEEPISFADLIVDPTFETKLICHEQTSSSRLISSVINDGTADSMVIAIGPEGGFTDEEVGSATSAGFHVVSLGERRLRAETAGIVAATAMLLRVPTEQSAGDRR